jgi:predicted metal-dependent phosphoesterase TrpH
MLRIDLHTHSIVSHDGGITVAGYRSLLEKKVLDYIAVTDHNSIEGAVQLQSELGYGIIVGEEILTSEGEIIGLFLQERIAPAMTPLETVLAIRNQGGVVYIPHPFERRRKGLSRSSFESIAEYIDIVEVFNGRGRLRGHHRSARQVIESRFAAASSSDAHSRRGVGTAYTKIAEEPTVENIVAQLREGVLVQRFAPVRAYLSPTINRIKKYAR